MLLKEAIDIVKAIRSRDSDKGIGDIPEKVKDAYRLQPILPPNMKKTKEKMKIKGQQEIEVTTQAMFMAGQQYASVIISHLSSKMPWKVYTELLRASLEEGKLTFKIHKKKGYLILDADAQNHPWMAQSLVFSMAATLRVHPEVKHLKDIQIINLFKQVNNLKFRVK